MAQTTASLAPEIEALEPPAAELAAERQRGRGEWVRLAAPWLVFGLALVLRLGWLDQAAFTYDEADAMLRARAVARGQLAQTGALTSWGIPDPPLLIYLLASVARLPSPAVASLALMALINALAVLATYHLTARFFGRRCGVLAGLLFAVNPWAIYFSRRAWVEVQPALTVLAVWSAMEVVEARRRRFALPFFLALAAGVQARLLAVVYGPAALVSLALGGGRWLSRWSILGVLGGAALTLPYLAYLFATREQIASALAEGSRGVASTPRVMVLEFAWWVTAGFNLLPAPTGLAPWLDVLGALLSVESWLAAVLLIAGVALCVVRCVRRGPAWRRYGLLLAWTALPLGLVALQSSAVYLHYMVLLLPLPFILLALPLEALFGQARLRWLGLVLFLGLALPQVAAWVSLQRTLSIYSADASTEPRPAARRVLAELAIESDQRIGTGESYGVEVPLRFWQVAADRTRAELAVQPRELLVAARGSNPLAEEQPAILETLLGPDLAPRYQTGESLVLPLGRPALLLITSDVVVPLGAERLGTERALIPLPTLGRGARDGIRLLDIPPRSFDDWKVLTKATTRRPTRNFDRPLAFYASSRPQPGESVEVLSLWPGPGKALLPAVALLDRGGERLAERDNQRRQPVDIRADQILVARHEISIPPRTPPGRYRLVVERLGPADQRPPRDLRTINVVPP